MLLKKRPSVVRESFGGALTTLSVMNNPLITQEEAYPIHPA